MQNWKRRMVELVYKKMKIRYPTHFMTLGKLAHGFLLICLISVVLLGLVTYFWALIISYYFQKYYSSRWLGPNKIQPPHMLLPYHSTKTNWQKQWANFPNFAFTWLDKWNKHVVSRNFGIILDPKRLFIGNRWFARSQELRR